MLQNNRMCVRIYKTIAALRHPMRTICRARYGTAANTELFRAGEVCFCWHCELYLVLGQLDDGDGGGRG